MQILSASTLIRDSLVQKEEQLTPQDHLRARNIVENQAALIEAFNRYVDPDTTLVILDAHVVIDTPDGLVHISSDVFREIAPDFVVFVKGEPRKIHRNRECDASRSRPERSVDHLEKQQEIAITAARDISDNLSIPIYFVNGGDEEALARVLTVAQKVNPDV
ncbi:AAA family ATPase [Phaeobacter gallaeciensis]|uniref:AAA family ATPase n=1 Tax=Phaeobacter gallaeciensis TaxID=60890 RepID=UPI000BBF6636|nr:AAA family ATPase [Phaeobacter gallaeciensis]ATF18234.1 adenylate kinase [Phaeobacter gallaeciensis]ATF22343.1 adenylate kinase [Phaeobacter gallaeciensis]